MSKHDAVYVVQMSDNGSKLYLVKYFPNALWDRVLSKKVIVEHFFDSQFLRSRKAANQAANKLARRECARYGPIHVWAHRKVDWDTLVQEFALVNGIHERWLCSLPVHQRQIDVSRNSVST